MREFALNWIVGQRLLKPDRGSAEWNSWASTFNAGDDAHLHLHRRCAFFGVQLRQVLGLQPDLHAAAAGRGGGGQWGRAEGRLLFVKQHSDTIRGGTLMRIRRGRTRTCRKLGTAVWLRPWGPPSQEFLEKKGGGGALPRVSQWTGIP